MAAPAHTVNQPKTSKDKPVHISECYSPVKSPSPQSQGKKQGNLTGSARKIQDAAADLHNFSLKWKKLNAEGASLVSQIANIRLEALAKTDPVDVTVSTEEDHTKFPPALEPMLQSLDNICQQMEKIVEKHQRLALILEGLHKLEQYQIGKSDCQTDPIVFWTWPIQKFETTVEELHQMYRKEVKLKRAILENICHTEDRNTIMFYTASWLHEPYIDNSADVLRESTLIETGHKPL